MGAALFFYTDLNKNKEEIAPGVFVAVNDIPQELNPVKNFVTQCLEDTSSNALKLLGQNGGYIDLDSSYSGKNFNIDNGATESDIVSFTEESNLKIPYWWYMNSPNTCKNCKFTSNRPDLRDGSYSIEAQLSKHIEQELSSCLGDFESLKQLGFEIKEKSKIKVSSKVTEEDVIFILDYDLEFKKGDTTSSLDQFFVRVPISLQKIYNLATDIMNMQQEFRFLERQVLNLIASFSSIDSNKLPPMSDMSFEFGSTTSWSKQDVQNNLQGILESYVPLLKVDSTKNFNREFYSSSLKQRLHDSMIIPITDSSYNNLQATFSYLDFWPPYFDMNCKGDICQPESVSSDLLSVIGIQRYNFFYDLSYPVLVNIFEEDALNGRGYEFNLFLESNIRNNNELRTGFAPLEVSSIELGSGLCDLGNRNSKPVTITTKDKSSSTPLGNVNIVFNVAGESCYIGSTSDNGTLISKFPAGTVGGTISFMHEDYLSESKLFDASLTDEKIIEEKLEPIADKSIEIKKKLLEKVGNEWVFTNKVESLRSNEEAFITLTRISSLEEDDFSAAANIQGTSKELIQIVPGKYTLNVNMFLRENLKIPERKVKKRTGLFEEEEFDIPGTEFNENNPFPSGGVNINITITKQDLEKNVITVFALSPALYDVPENLRELEDLQQSANVHDYSKVFEALLKPVFQ